MRAISPRERRLVAVGLLVAVIAVAWLGVIQPLLGSFSSHAAERENLRRQYAANERLVARIPFLRRAAEDQARLGADYALQAPDADQAGEVLRARLEDSLTKAGGELRSSDIVEAEPGWAGASASALVSNAQLIDWLRRLQTEPPYLALEAMSISADRALNSNHLDLLDVKIEASIPLAAPNQR